MKKKHLDFLLKFHKPTSRHLYTLRNSGIITTKNKLVFENDR